MNHVFLLTLQAAEWLCLNCQTQRAVSGQLGDLDKMSQPLGLSSKSSPKHPVPAEQLQKPSTPNVTSHEKTTDQLLKNEITKLPEGKLGQIDVVDRGSIAVKPVDNKSVVMKEDTMLVAPIVAEALPIKEHKQDPILDTTLVAAEHLQSKEKMMSKQDLMIDLSATALKEIDGRTCDERIKPEASQLADQETGKEKTVSSNCYINQLTLY